ncbi:MAG TPA: LPXTG cell wall anchor domain-containing protein [Micromonosporaceae bacterium]|nr:LPXTG cell wall anchor domain-containing protein [Micromonosporaceae bacterium]
MPPVTSFLAKRACTLLGAATVGTLAAVGVDTPAFAHDVRHESRVECVAGQPGKIRVTWTLTNTERHREATVTGARSPIGDIAMGARLPARATAGAGAGTLVGSEIRPLAAGTAAIDVELTWKLRGADIRRTVAQTVSFAGRTCGPEQQPAAAYTSRCDGTAGVVLTNPTEQPRRVTVAGAGGWKQTEALPAQGHARVIVPEANAADVTVTASTGDGRGAGDDPVIGRHQWEKPTSCAAPDVSAAAGCDGKSLLLTNPAGNDTVTAVVTVGGVVTTVQVPGGTTRSVRLALDALTADVDIAGIRTLVRFDDLRACSAGDILPVTGADATLLAGSAAGLIGAGVGLVWLARRRRIRFLA